MNTLFSGENEETPSRVLQAKNKKEDFAKIVLAKSANIGTVSLNSRLAPADFSVGLSCRETDARKPVGFFVDQRSGSSTQNERSLNSPVTDSDNEGSVELKDD